MKRKLTKGFAAAMAATLCISTASLGGITAAASDDSADPLQLAFVLYDWSDDQGTYLESYLNYLADNLNITVECVSYTDSVEDMINVIESLCSKGVDGIAVASDEGFQSWAQICEDNEVYCSIMLGRLGDEDDREFAAGLDYYLGSLGTYDYSFLGEAYANYIIESGYESVLIAAPSQGLQDQSDQMVEGSVAVLEEAGITYELIQTAWSDLFSSVAAAVAAADYDVIYCPLSVMSFGVPQIYTNNLIGQTVVMGHGTDESMADAIDSGIVAMFSDNLTTSVGVNVALMINAIEGTMYEDYPADECVNIQSPTFLIQNEEDFEIYTEYIRNFDDPVYYISADAVKDMIVSFNSEATFEGVKSYIEGLSLENVAENAK
ncbi:MAG: substrate-binding domain-containing protein [Clostridiales bacterium]|nr:substrate-binding domain-containing protein [Clostridiales bacterium]